MAGLTLALANTVLKEDYHGPIRDQLNNNSIMLSQIDKNTRDVVGRRAVHAIHITRNSGVGARADGGALPTAGSQGHLQPYIPIRHNYGHIQITGPTIAAMASDRGSFVRAVELEMGGLVNDTSRDVNRQVWGTSNGVIATCGTTSAANLVVLAATTTQTQLDQLYGDGSMYVDIGTVANPISIAQNRQVTAVGTTASPTITISGATVTTTSAAFVFRTGGGGASSQSGFESDGQVELTGLQDIVSATTTLHQVVPATYPVWQATVAGASGVNRNVSEALVNQQIHAVARKGGQGIDLLVGSDGVSRAVAQLMTSIRRNIDNVSLQAGYSGIQWSAPGEGMGQRKPIALIWEKDAPGNKLFGINTSSLVEYVMDDWGWMDLDGGPLHLVTGYDAYEAVFRKYHELACLQRNANFRIDDLSEA